MTYISTRLKKDIHIDSIITIHYFEYMKDFIFEGESHDFWEMLYVDKGDVSVCADNEWHTMTAGDIIFHRPNEFHAFESIGRKAPNLVAISFYCFSPVMHEFHKLRSPLTQDERALISQIIAEARTTFSTPLSDPGVEQIGISEHAPFGAQQLISLHLEEFLILMKRNHIDNMYLELGGGMYSFQSPANIAAKLTQFEQISAYMGKHICDHLTVPAICEEFSISRSALQSLFHRECSCGAIEYFSKMKIEYAKEMIRLGSMNFTEIAHYLSYSSLQYFSKQFKKSTGMSPLEYSSSVKGMSHSFSSQTHRKG